MSKKITKKARPASKAKAKPKAKKATKKVAKAAPKAKKAKAVAKPAKKKAVVKAKAKPAAKKAGAKKAVAKKVVAKKAIAKKTVAKKPVKVVAKAKEKVAEKVVSKKPAVAVQKPAKPAKAAKPAKRTEITRHNMPFHKRDQIRQIVPPSKVNPNKTRYSDAELDEFRAIIQKKLADARKELNTLQSQLTAANEHGTDDTANTFKMLEDGSDSLAKEEAGQLAGRQKKFIEQLENAMIRIENKTYGVCRVTGKLIPKERLRAVPHTTQSIEAKLNQYRE
jgi:RNA polymerase-binding transcription factor DksA